MNSLEMNNIEEIKTLNPYQQEAVLDESPACLVNANVGSGKTTVLIEKVRHLHEKKQVSYEKMVVLTFTNKAADEIAERLSRKEAELTEEELWGFADAFPAAAAGRNDGFFAGNAGCRKRGHGPHLFRRFAGQFLHGRKL